MWKFFQRAFGDLIAALIILAGPAIVGGVALLESPPWYAVALAMIAAPGAAFWSIAQVKGFWRLRQQTVEKSGDIIRKWLDHTRLSVANDPLSNAYYRYKVTQGSRMASVYRDRDDPDVVGIGINLNVPQADYEALYSITSSNESNLLSDLRIEMMRLGIQYSGLMHPLRTVSFVDSVAFDQNLTRPAFIDRIFFMFRAQVLLGEFIEREARRADVSLTMVLPQSR